MQAESFTQQGIQGQEEELRWRNFVRGISHTERAILSLFPSSPFQGVVPYSYIGEGISGDLNRDTHFLRGKLQESGLEGAIYTIQGFGLYFSPSISEEDGEVFSIPLYSGEEHSLAPLLNLVKRKKGEEWVLCSLFTPDQVEILDGLSSGEIISIEEIGLEPEVLSSDSHRIASSIHKIRGKMRFLRADSNQTQMSLLEIYHVRSRGYLLRYPFQKEIIQLKQLLSVQERESLRENFDEEGFPEGRELMHPVRVKTRSCLDFLN